MAQRPIDGSGRWIRLCVDLLEDGTPIGGWSWEVHDEEGALEEVGCASFDVGPFDTAEDVFHQAQLELARRRGWQLTLPI